MDNQVTKSWFCVFNNPEEHGYTGTPEEIIDKMKEEWIKDNPQRTCALAYCISEKGLKHIHAVFEDQKAMRFTTIKKLYPKMHIEPTKGNKEQAEDYINKRGKFTETGEVTVCMTRHGEIKGVQGSRRDLSIIEDMINQGKKPDEIMDMSINYRRYEKMIKDTYYRYRWKNTPITRDVKVYWHIGETGSGKSYEMVSLIEKHGEDEVYLLTDYENGFDKYSGEKVLFMDEFRGQIRYNQLLVILDVYRAQIKCRYTNIYALWNEVHITSILPPERAYKKMVEDNRDIDTIEQLLRRIDCIVYHYKLDGKYKKVEVDSSEYTDYDDLKKNCENAPQWVLEAYMEMRAKKEG